MKFKNIKNKAKIAKFPSNSRSITDKFPPFSSPFPKISHAKLIHLYRGALEIFLVFIFIIAATVVGIDLQKNFQTKINIDFQREILGKDLNFWNDFISQHENYPNAYLQASVLEYKLGDISKAKTYIEKGLFLDPNSAEGLKVEQLLK